MISIFDRANEMCTTLATIENAVRPLRQDESLLFLNHLLAVSRGNVNDRRLAAELAKLEGRPIAYVVHFVAMQLLLHSSFLGVPVLDWPKFLDVLNMLHDLPDPIQHDPNWKHANPAGAVERMMQQQLPSQDRNMLQKLGLYSGLFRDVGIADGYDLRKEIETALGMTVDEFMTLGFVCGALRAASLGVGTFTPEYLSEAFVQGIKVCTPELWRVFLDRICCTPQQFREKQTAFSAGSSAYPQFEFNLIRQYPIIEIVPGRFLAVDPELIVERVTYGLFYDLFDRDRFAFSEHFGASFERFVGVLLRSPIPAGSVWSHADWKEANPHLTIKGKVSDHAYVGGSDTILFECKSLRPTVKLISVADETSMSHLTSRIADGLRQLIEHNEAIKAGKWTSAGLPQRDATAFVLVMYGQLYNVNTVFWRQRIYNRLREIGLESRPFVVLSISDLDSVLRLVELGHRLESVIVDLCDSLKSLHSFPELKTDSVSAYSRERAKALLDGVKPA